MDLIFKERFLDSKRVVIPDFLGGCALGEEEEVGLDAAPAAVNADDTPQVAIVQELKGRTVGKRRVTSVILV